MDDMHRGMPNVMEGDEQSLLAGVQMPRRERSWWWVGEQGALG